MAKMTTVRHVAVGKYQWDEHDQARIERNLFAFNGETWEALRFCKYRDGRHNRVHLVIGEENFIELFRDAVKNGVFHEETREQLRKILESPPEGKQGRRPADPLWEVIGIGADGKLTQGIDEELYGENKA